jgi:hypothetical protein
MRVSLSECERERERKRVRSCPSFFCCSSIPYAFALKGEDMHTIPARAKHDVM